MNPDFDSFRDQYDSGRGQLVWNTLIADLETPVSAMLKLADGRVLEDSRSCGVATNNVGELTAIDMAIDLLEGAGIEPTASVALFTDSSYAIGVLQKGWKAKANVTLILGLRQRLRAWPGLSLHWVPGHSGVPENERADELAVAGCVG